MSIFRVRLHEIGYRGNTVDGAGGWVDQFMVKAATAEVACRKAMLEARKRKYSACRVTLCVEEGHIGDLLS